MDQITIEKTISMDSLEVCRAVFESSPDAVVVTDESGRILLASKQVEKMFGFQRNEVIGQTVELLMPSRYAKKHRAYRNQYVENPETRPMGGKKEFRAMRKDGSEFFIEISLSPIKLEDGNSLISAAIRDVTEKHLANQALQESEEKLKEAHRLAKIGSWELNNQTYQLSWSDETYQIFEVDRSTEISFEKFLFFIPTEDREMLLKAYAESLKNRLPYNLIHRIQLPGGRIKFVEEQCRVQYDEAGRPLFSYGTVQDISERYEAALVLERKNRELLDKNKELEQFAYIASHDLQEPLHTIIGLVNILKIENGGKMDANSEVNLQFMLESANRMKDLVKGLLDYSRIGKEKELELIDCNQLVKEVLKDLGETIRVNNATIRLGKLPVLKGYRIELRQLFQNLLSNAIKFRKKEEEPVVSVSAERKINKWLFSVRDNGIGIEEQNKGEIFIIFRRLHNRNEYEGTGIGLAHCKKIVGLHGGEIWVESAPGNGSAFYFQILNL